MRSELFSIKFSRYLQLERAPEPSTHFLSFFCVLTANMKAPRFYFRSCGSLGRRSLKAHLGAATLAGYCREGRSIRVGGGSEPAVLGIGLDV